MASPIRLRGHLDWRDLLAAQLLHMSFARQVAMACTGIFGVWIGGFSLFHLLGRGFPVALPGPLLFAIAIAAVCALVFRYILVPRRAFRQYSQLRALQEPFELEIDERGLRARNTLGSSERPWSSILCWSEDERTLVLYQGPTICSFLPKRIFAGHAEIESLKGLLEAHGIPRAGAPLHGLAWPMLAVALWAMLLLFRVG